MKRGSAKTGRNDPGPVLRPVNTGPSQLAPDNAPRTKAAWTAVGLLWVCGFFNYADRQAVFAVFPLLQKEFQLDDTAKGLIGSAFMVVYALASPFTGALVDRFSRRWLVSAGLALWSVICAATALARSYPALLAFRAAEGLGESCYFPASMSLLADHHAGRTRSRAMSMHQTSVYLGTALGAVLAGSLGVRFGWRAPFLVLGVLGLFYALLLPALLTEPRRGSDSSLAVKTTPKAPHPAPPWLTGVRAIFGNPTALALMAAFFAANFVATAFLTWLPDFVYRKFVANVEGAALVAGLPWPLANLVGALLGGVLADLAIKRHAGGRAAVQALGLLAGTPWILAVGSTDSLPVLIVSLIGAGLCKGLYDANIFASLYDVVPPEVRGVAAGLMNTVGWTGGFLSPFLVGIVSDRSGLSRALTLLTGFYLLAGICAACAAWKLQRASKARTEAA